MRCGGYQPPAFQCGHAARLCHLHWESFGMTASGHKQTGHHDMGQVRFTPECVAKTIFTTRTSNIDSRTSTSAKRRFKNTVQLDSIIARSQHLRRQVMGCGIWACLMMWVIRVAPTGSKASPNVRYALINEPTRCARAQNRCAIARCAGSPTASAVIGGEIVNSGRGALS